MKLTVNSSTQALDLRPADQAVAPVPAEVTWPIPNRLHVSGDWFFRAAIVVSLGMMALFLYLRSENGRYQFIENNGTDYVLDTRTGEFWSGGAGTIGRVDLRRQRIDAYTPTIIDHQKKQ